MTVYLQDTDLTLHHGDCLEVLRTLPDRSVHMCATSPPFYGLRDYGTGEWEGGNPDCDHKAPSRFDYAVSDKQFSNTGSEQHATFRSLCGKCGARRVDQQIGLEETPDQWVERLVAVFREVRRVLRDDGTLWVEIGDSYSGMPRIPFGDQAKREHGTDADRLRKPITPGCKQKDLLGQPWLLAFALRADGWYLRSEIIWARPNPMPESVTDRPTKSHSTVFLLSKRPRYFYDADAIREPSTPGMLERAAAGHTRGGTNGRDASRGDANSPFGQGVVEANGANARSVWQIPTEPTPFAHFATWPRKLVARMILAGTSERGCCPVCGAPWARETESEYTKHRPSGGMTSRVERGNKIHDDGFGGWGSFGTNLRKHTETVGWSPSCTCAFGDGLGPRKPIPCTVLDPFAGSGTTLLVARQHGRHSIGIELNPAYCELVRDRTSQQSLLADAQ